MRTTACDSESCSRPVAPFTLPGSHPLLLAILALLGKVKRELRAPVAPAQHGRLIPEYAFPVDMGEYSAYRLHPEPRLGQVGVIVYQDGRKMALPEILTADNVGDKRGGHSVNQSVPVYMVEF